MKYLLLLAAVLPPLFCSCQEQTTMPPSPPMTTEQIGRNLTDLLGAGLPENARNVSGGVSGIPFTTFHCGFFGTSKDLDALIASSPVLAKAQAAAKDAPKQPGAPYLLTSWIPTGSRTTRIAKIEVSSLSENDLRIDLYCLQIEGIELK